MGDGFEVSFLPPARVADGLEAGELDVGLVPAIELQRISGLRALPGTCVAARSEVRSVLLISRRDIGEVRRVALDENSRTSAALVRILLREAHGVEAEYLEAPADLEAMLAEADAALLIGDPALHVDRESFQVLDLAAEWRSLTGLPFVFAVWAVREEAAVPGLDRPFRDSLALAEAEMEELIREAREDTGLEVAELRDYLTRCLRFHLGAREIAGLEEFYRRAHRHGLIAKPVPLGLDPE